MLSGLRIRNDDRYRILTEYQNKTKSSAGKRAGDVFVKWVLRYKANPNRCDQVALVDNAERGFESFPDDERLANFDSADRKFVAVAGAHGAFPPIAQATDSKWLEWAPALRSHGIALELLCGEDIHEFEKRRKRRKEKAR